jgi:16S rRNA (adenine1518-N6/adenine1519-N6)-dimethyltransferase
MKTDKNKYRAPRAKDSLKAIGVVPSKQRGQNFIIDRTVVETIVSFGAIVQGQNLVEIGPGLGALTELLIKASDSLAVIEIEQRFYEDIKERFPQIKAHCADVREFDFAQLGNNLLVFGNLPYSFSTDIIFHLLDNAHSINRAVLMLQREFAERVSAPPGSRTYGVLSIMTQLRADTRLGPVISGDSFHPKANVESILLELTMLPEPRFGVRDLKWFRKIVQGAFLQRRKKVRNSLRASGVFPGPELLDQVLKDADIDPDARAEVLSIQDFARLTECGRAQLSKQG